jgi:hypothetical protein
MKDSIFLAVPSVSQWFESRMNNTCNPSVYQESSIEKKFKFSIFFTHAYAYTVT